MAGLFDVLDTLSEGVASVAGRVVDAKTQIAIARDSQNGPERVPDKSAAAPAAALSGSTGMSFSNPLLWVGAGLVLLLAIALIARKG